MLVGSTFHHGARHGGRAEGKHIGFLEKLYFGADIGAGARQHVADMADVVDHEAFRDDRVFDGEDGIVEALLDWGCHPVFGKGGDGEGDGGQ